MSDLPLLHAHDMATFAARGFLRMDGVVPDAINAQFMDEVGEIEPPEPGRKLRRTYGELLAKAGIPEVGAGVPLARTYAQGSAIARMLELPAVAGAIRSLVGEDPTFDHHFLHVTFPPAYHAASGGENVSQHTHQDSTIDPRQAFDLQIMYYPHAVTRPMGGTRFVPGTHLRKVSEAALGRYQNIRGQQHMVCEAGTLLFLHSGVWHGGGVNLSDRTRTMFKIRMNPSRSQARMFDTSTLEQPTGQRPIFYLKGAQPRTVEQILMTPEPWFEDDTGRLEFVNRVKFWRYLTGDATYDADYWLTRLENLATA
ncbi:MAG: phytanoyl-CoA dioxygenase family protein [Alphaproteobacteria bacterium]|nr:phytanoyl-CoA dioxygenase family protein [Alphaproteobacteria bacterium]MBU1513123.1 phytanoyl-CoA dioxygenase family protein [Alphaproteobacteria bacterium]MBU2095231.1 phytanoyl-CoA dioxygenase family protein [Alphaproteobacteria bacterium]MBU2150610.1 phytanoyl-CoA dioxygenase family protein [Alphaproteobacteria bacterium]MBU2306131.1 phytanoyl-CoA dioxygenase family protein [Alphaproteobacteria bacterium]